MIIIIPRPRTACGRDTVVVVLVSIFRAFFRLFYWIFIFIIYYTMQSTHTCTVGLCFLAYKASLFWSIFQENSVKTRFLHHHIAVFVGHTLWLAMCGTQLVRCRWVRPCPTSMRWTFWMFELVSDSVRLTGRVSGFS